MIIKQAKYKNKMVKQRICVSQEVYGCDECKTEIKEYPNELNRLETTVFYNNDEKADHLHFCSWDCVLKNLSKIKTDYFVSLPYVHFDVKGKKGARHLIKLLNKAK